MVERSKRTTAAPPPPAEPAPPSPSADDVDFPQTYEHTQAYHAILPRGPNISDVSVPIVLPTPPEMGPGIKVLPIRVAVQYMSNSSIHSLGVSFTFGCPDFVTTGICANPVSHTYHHVGEHNLVIPGQMGGFAKQFDQSDPLVIHDRTSKLRKLAEEVDQVYFGVQPSDVKARAPTTTINNARYVLILNDEQNYASDAILQYLNDNRNLPQFRANCQVVNGGVTAVKESAWDTIFSPFVEKLKDVVFIPNDQSIIFRRLDNHPFGAMPQYWEGDFSENNLTDPQRIELVLCIHYLILKPNLSLADRQQGPFVNTAQNNYAQPSNYYPQQQKMAFPSIPSNAMPYGQQQYAYPYQQGVQNGTSSRVG